MACSPEPGGSRVGIWSRPLPARAPVDDCSAVAVVVKEGSVVAVVKEGATGAAPVGVSAAASPVAEGVLLKKALSVLLLLA